jgi:adenosylhomocysteine nucleosidase
MLRHLVAGWLREQAQQTLARTLDPDTDSAQDQPPRRCEIAVFFPSRAEAGSFVDQLAGGNTTRCHGFVEHTGQLAKRTICAIEAPVAPDRLARITRDVIGLRKPRWLISAGFAVALDAKIRKGHMVMARRVMDAQGYSLQTGLQLDDESLQTAHGVHAGALLTVTDFPTSAGAKQTLSSEHASLACDRQAMIIAEVCRVQHVPILSVHAIVEGFGEQSATTVQRVRSQNSLAAKIGAAAGALIDRPSSVKQFFTEKETALRLSDRLAKFLAGMLERLPD